MSAIIIASHGDFAQGLLKTASMIIGEMDHVQAIGLYPGETGNDIYRKMELAMQDMLVQEALIAVDLWGGTPCNQALLLAEKYPGTAVFAGINLPLLITACFEKESKNPMELAISLMNQAQESVHSYPEAKVRMETQKATPKQALQKGIMHYPLVRIDSRLLHGQVVTGWLKSVKGNRIIVVSDAVAHDDLRKQMLKQAGPSGMPVNIVPVDKLIEVCADERFGGVEAILLFENVQDVVRAKEGGVPISCVNVGSIAHREGKVAVNKAIALDEDDIACFEKLAASDIAFDVRKVPSDAQEDMKSILDKAKIMLGKEG